VRTAGLTMIAQILRLMRTNPRRHRPRLLLAALGQTPLQIVFAILGLGMTPQQQIHELSLYFSKAGILRQGCYGSIADKLGLLLNSGGQGRNRTTDTRIFKTNHSPCIDWPNAKNFNKFSDSPVGRRNTTEPSTELLWLIGCWLAILSNSINGMHRGSPIRCRYCAGATPFYFRIRSNADLHSRKKPSSE
jgi:hypothetical protein